MNNKKILTITILAIFVVGMIIGAAEAAHTIKYGKYKVKISNKEYKKLNQYETKYKRVKKAYTEKVQVGNKKIPKYESYIEDHDIKYYSNKYNNKTQYKIHDVSPQNVNEDETYVLLISSNETGSWSWAGYHLYKIERGTYNHTVVSYDYEPIYKNRTYYDYIKVPYKVRIQSHITKKVPKKYFYYKEPTPIVKTVKVKKTIGKYIYVGKHLGFGLQTPDLRKNMQNNMKNLRAKGWKIHWNKRTGQIGSDGLFKWHCYCTKNVYKKERRVVGYKYKTVKEPIFMSMSTVAVDKGKVIVEIWSHAGPICSGTIKV